jgi:hypothetical protein
MADLKLDILVIPTYSSKTLGIADASLYPDDPPVVSAATIEITIPGFAKVVLPFSVDNFTVYTSSTLGLTEVGTPDLPLPDGIYNLKYSIAPAYLNYVEKSIVRVERLQEKFDEAFMQTDMMECDKAIRTQTKVDLSSIYFLIQGAIAAGNNCAVDSANKLYLQADKMLNNIIGNRSCSGSNFITNF